MLETWEASSKYIKDKHVEMEDAGNNSCYMPRACEDDPKDPQVKVTHPFNSQKSFLEPVCLSLGRRDNKQDINLNLCVMLYTEIYCGIKLYRES